MRIKKQGKRKRCDLAGMTIVSKGGYKFSMFHNFHIVTYPIQRWEIREKECVLLLQRPQRPR